MDKCIELTAEEQGNTFIVSLKGRVDTVSAQQFDAFIDTDISDFSRHFVVSMSELEYISSAGLRSLIRMGKKIQQAAGSLVLCGARGIVLEVFRISGFNKLFHMVDSVTEALEDKN